MNHGALVELVGGLPCFDLALLVQASGERREGLRVQLSRWMKAGRVVGLRRGVYTLAEAWRRAPAPLPLLANRLYRPSYLSGLWALAHHDLIPEHVYRLTSVTTRVPRTFENSLGVFEYRHLKQGAFFGCAPVAYGGETVLVAEPEKALLDHWHLTAGEWTPERLTEMRYQHVGRIDPGRLREFAARFDRPRLHRAASRFLALRAAEGEGTVTL